MTRMNSGKLAALLDTGTSLAYIPDYITDAIYSSIDGSAYSPDDGNWYIPCLSDPTLSITIGLVFPLFPTESLT
jgi:saccharopepsin